MSMQQHNIFMIGWEYPPHNSGGLGEACAGMTKALAGMNSHIYFTLPYALGAAPSHMDVLECSDPEWFAEGSSDNPPFFAYTQARQTAFVDGKIDVATLQVLPTSELETKVDRYAELVSAAGVAKKKEVDVIHAHDWMSFPAAIRLSDTIKKPFVAHIHSTEFDRIPHGNGSNYILQTEYEGMQHATRVVAVSYYTKHILVKKYGIDPNKIDVVYNGIEPYVHTPPKQTTFAHEQPVIVFMGRLTMQKGAEYFLQLAHAVLQRLPSALFVVAGDGDMYHELLFKTADKKLSASVLFTGFVRGEQRAKLLDRADVFVMPSLSEPFGLVALEAAQRHTPVIISKHSGVSEVLPGSKIVDFWDIGRMVHEIEQIVGSPSHAQSIVASQLADLEKVTWNASAQRLQSIYSKAFIGA